MLSALKNENGPFAGPVPYVSRTRLRREGRAASTTRLRLGIDEGKAARQPLLDVVERRAIQVEIALLVDDDLDPVDLELLVVRPDLAVELQGVREPGAAPPLHAHPQKHGIGPVLGPLELLHLLGRRLRQCDRHEISSSDRYVDDARASATACFSR